LKQILSNKYFKIAVLVLGIVGLVLLGLWALDYFKSPSEGIPEGAEMPLSERDRVIKMYSFIFRAKDEIAQFAVSLYDETEGGFRIKAGDPVTLAANFYGLETLNNLSRLDIRPNQDDLLGMIRSRYIESGYYSDPNEDPVFSTSYALRFNRYYSEDLGKEIDLNWLEENSISNENLAEEKKDPEYQLMVWGIYKHLEIPKEERFEKLENLSSSYFDYYCGLDFSGEESDSSYLEKKYFQIFLISDMSGIDNVKELTSNCLEKETIDKDKERLKRIDFKKIQDIKELYWFYYLQRFYGLGFDLEEILEHAKDFYSNRGFKEKLSEKESNLTAAYYGTLFIK
jgi:hypothetical protein